MAVPGPKFQSAPGVPAYPNYLEVVLQGHSVETVGTQKSFNIFHFVKVFESGAGPAPVGPLTTTLTNLLLPSFNNALSIGYVGDAITGRYMDDITFPAVPVASPFNGLVGGDRLPSFAAVVIRKTTPVRGRSYRGSNHFGPVAEGDTLLDELTAGAVATWGALATAIAGMRNVADANLNQWSLCVISSTLSTLTTNPTSFTGAVVDATILNSTIGTMKRRKQGVGA